MPMKKIIVSNLTALKKKYLNQVFQIEAALYPIQAADKAQDIDTTVIYVDDAAQMTAVGGLAVTDPNSDQQNKAAIDAIFNHSNPDYMLILGANDIIPQQRLNNPVLGDHDPNVPSDLPYACTHGYSVNILDFVAPTRIVSRLPDLVGIPNVGAKDTSYLVHLMSNVADRSQKPKNSYLDYFGLSTLAWENSTKLSLRNTFGNDASILLSPTEGPNWTPEQIRKLSHFINCHGGDSNPNFYGDNGAIPRRQPVCMESKLMDTNTEFGCIASVECCYGAQLYNPNLATFMGICNSYLSGGCVSYFGSTNVAYGPAAGNGSADIITQKFLQHLLAGSRAGLAAQDARLDFIASEHAPLKPIAQKTLAQFTLLGDPVMNPVEQPSPIFDKDENLHQANLHREGSLKAFGISQSVGGYVQSKDIQPPESVQNLARKIGEEHGEADQKIYAYESKWPTSAAKAFVRKELQDTRLYLVGIEEKKTSDFSTYVMYEITELNNSILDIKKYYSK